MGAIMAHKVFIDGEVGTTGLKIRERLAPRADIELIQVAPERRKDPDARREAMAASEVTILCLPDAAAVESVALAEGLDTRFVDASTAHRVAEGWLYGFPEMSADIRAALPSAKYVSNPGCFPTGALGLIAPLVAQGVLAADEVASINAVSGYTGGGKELIAQMEAEGAPDHFIYGLAQTHKHLPEITQHARLTRRPVFAPSVGRYAQGMVVQVPVQLNGRKIATFRDALDSHYAGSRFVRVVEPEARVVATKLNDTNMLELSVHGSDENGVAVLVAVLDNLGKGASGAAVQNLNLMIGADEGAGL